MAGTLNLGTKGLFLAYNWALETLIYPILCWEKFIFGSPNILSTSRLLDSLHFTNIFEDHSLPFILPNIFAYYSPI